MSAAEPNLAAFVTVERRADEDHRLVTACEALRAAGISPAKLAMHLGTAAAFYGRRADSVRRNNPTEGGENSDDGLQREAGGWAAAIRGALD